jgi:hypothetical protein
VLAGNLEVFLGNNPAFEDISRVKNSLKALLIKENSGNVQCADGDFDKLDDAWSKLCLA